MMRPKSLPVLNEAQRQLAAENHDLIYWYLHKRGLSIEDYYDILAIGLCKAAAAYKPELGAFSTLAIQVFDHEIQRERKITTRRQNFETESLDENVYEDIPLYNMLASFNDRFRYTQCWLTILETVKSLSPLDKLIFTYYAFDGLTFDEIGKRVGRSRQSVCNRMRKIQKLVQERL